MAVKKAARVKAASRDVPLATRAIERLLCDPHPFGDIERAYPRAADAWTMELPDLTSLPRPTGPKRRTRFCIATEDIVGPVRNGGIGTTYAALARLLAADGHDITILYLKGEEVENETIGHWIDHYATQGVKFVPVTNYAQTEDIATNSDQWMRPVYNMYRWLLDNPMDVVHVSEWRGSAFMCLTAKRQGIAFADTLFIVKTSSPWLWNRMYGSFAIDRLGDLAKTLAERRSVELADMVVGGSLHLMRWMASWGYVLPRKRAFVQPNVISFAHLEEFMARRNVKPGRRLPIDEIVFFGRLEARKGLLTFCHAIRRLMRLGHKLPGKISFMGKPGARLSVRPHQTVIEYIEEETADWPVQVSILTDFQQQDAISYLLDGARLAVMPSTIENSSLAVYEAAICHIPFIASDAGGTPELLAEKDRKHVLCDAHPIPLAAKLAEAIDKGGYVAAASFDNQRNLQVWADFHESLCRGLRQVLLERASPRPRGKTKELSVDVAIFSRGDAHQLELTLDSLAAQKKRPGRVLIAVDAVAEAAATEMARRGAKARRLDFEVLATLDYDAGYAFNEAARHSRADYIVFLQAGSTLEPQALRVLTDVARQRGGDLLTWHHRLVTDGEADAGQLVTEMIGGPAITLFLDNPRDLPLLVRRSAFRKLEGFTVDYRVPLHARELISKAIVSGLACETVPLDLGKIPDPDPARLERECYDANAGGFRILRPYLAALPLAMREVVLATIGMQRRLPKNARRITTRRAGEQHTPARAPSPGRPDATKHEAGVEPVSAKSDKLKPVRNKPFGLAPARTDGHDVLVALTGEMAAGHTWRLVNSNSRKSHGADGWHTDQVIKAILDDPSHTGSLPRHLQLFSGWAGPDASDGKRYEGRVLDIAEGAVIGWIADRESPETPVTIEVRVNGRRIARVDADLDLPSVYQMSDLAIGHGFRVPLFKGLVSRFLKPSQPARVDVVTGTGVVLARALEAWPPGKPIRKSRYQGYLDAVADATVRGWVWMPAEPERRLHVTIYLDGRFYTRLRADVYRADLADNGIGGGDYAFSLRIPQRFRDSEMHQVDVFVADTGIRLQGTPLTINRHGQSPVAVP